VLVPEGASLCVKLGDRVRGGSSVLAVLPGDIHSSAGSTTGLRGHYLNGRNVPDLFLEQSGRARVA
jgi:hypothetical protein